MTVEVRPDLVTSLGVIRGDVVHHLAGVSRYRAMRNLEQTMADIAEFQDLVMPLRDVRGQIERQLQETREYRALCAIDSIIPQVVEVLAFLDEKSNFADNLRVVSEPQIAVASAENGDEEHSAEQPEHIPEPSDVPFTVARDEKPDDGAFDPSQNPDTADDNLPDSDESSDQTASPPVATLVQSLLPSTNNAKNALSDSQAGLATTINSDQAAREGRAA